MIDLIDKAGELLRSSESLTQLTVPEKTRVSIISLASRVADSHPWSQEINMARSQQKAAEAVDRLIPPSATPPAYVNEGPVTDHRIVEEAVRQIDQQPAPDAVELLKTSNHTSELAIDSMAYMAEQARQAANRVHGSTL